MKTRFLAAAAGLMVAATGVSATPTGTTAAGPLTALAKAKTIQVTETMLSAPASGPVKPIATMTVQFSRPGLMHMEQRHAGTAASADPDMMMVSDGTTLYDYDAAQKQYRKEAAPSSLGAAGLPGLAAFPPTAKAAAVTLDGKPVRLYTNLMDQGARKVTFKLWEDTRTGLPVQQSVLLTTNGATHEVQRILFSGWVLDKPIDAKVFAFAPPAGATEYAEPKLLADGTAAPDFTVQDRDGKPVKLSDYRGKVVVLDFWSTWCGPCQASLPHTNEVAQKFKDKKVVVLAVNVWDTQDAFDKWLPAHKQFDAISFAIDPTKEHGQDVATRLYGVSGIPTQYVIDPSGKVVKSFVGFDGPTDDLANAITGALKTAAPAQ